MGRGWLQASWAGQWLQRPNGALLLIRMVTEQIDHSPPPPSAVVNGYESIRVEGGSLTSCEPAPPHPPDTPSISIR